MQISHEKVRVLYLVDEARAALKARDVAKALYESFITNHEIAGDFDKLTSKSADITKTLEELEFQRNAQLKQNTTIDDKVGELAQIQAKLIDLQLTASQDRVASANLSNEQNKVSASYEGLVQESSQIEKNIFTHDKLNLFAMELCPFCMNKTDVSPDIASVDQNSLMMIMKFFFIFQVNTKIS